MWTWLPIPLGLAALLLGLLLDAPALLVIGCVTVALRLLGAILPWDSW